MSKELILDHDVSPKIGVVVEEGCTTWTTVLTEMVYQFVNIYSLLRTNQLLQGDTLDIIEPPPHNNMGKFGIYNNTLFFNKNV